MLRDHFTVDESRAIVPACVDNRDKEGEKEGGGKEGVCYGQFCLHTCTLVANHFTLK